MLNQGCFFINSRLMYGVIFFKLLSFVLYCCTFKFYFRLILTKYLPLFTFILPYYIYLLHPFLPPFIPPSLTSHPSTLSKQVSREHRNGSSTGGDEGSTGGKDLTGVGGGAATDCKGFRGGGDRWWWRWWWEQEKNSTTSDTDDDTLHGCRPMNGGG